jgi:two-component system, OmpR family, sensor histidine kinase KdpD
MRSESAVPNTPRDDPRSSLHPARRSAPADYALAVAGSIAAVVVASLAQIGFGLKDLSPVFMLAVLAVAARTRTGPALATALLCFLAYNYFFFEPRFTFYISAREGVATIALFLAAALLAGRMASRLAMQVQALRASNRRVLLRQQLGQRLAAAADAVQVADATQAFFHDHLALEAVVRTGTVAAAAADVASGWWFLPLGTPHEELGVLGLKLAEPGRGFDDEQRRLIDLMAGDIAQALLRTRLVADLQSVRVANETERLRSALLSSVSHDLRTPLAGMLGAAESLQSYGDRLGESDRRALLDTVREEGRRLDRYIQNLLDMTRLGHGTLVLKRDWIGVDEVVGSAIRRLQRYQPGVRFSVTVSSDIGPIWVHPALLEQAIFNVIENAARFTPPGDVISVDARLLPGRSVCIDISDRGPGIPGADRERIFEMFYSGDRGPKGTGLGLAICRGMIGAHGGQVEALPGADGRGTTIRITLPLLEPDATGAAA